MSLIKSSAVVASMTLLSRVFGFIRDVMIAFYLGAGMQTDAFFVAFKLPNFMRRLFAEGAFNSAFLPMFAGLLKTEGEEKALRFASESYSFLLAVLIVFVIAAMLFMPHLMWFLAPGFQDDPEKYTLTVLLTRISFPYLIFISLVCLLGGILNSFEKFAAVAATPILLNICMIFFAVAFSSTLGAANALTWSLIVSGIAQLSWLAFFCRRIGAMPKLRRPRMTPQVKRLLIIIGPAALGAGVVQINSMVDMMIASLFDDAVSFLYYAERVYELPLGVIGIAVATALLPALSKHIRAGEMALAHRDTNHAIMLTMFFGLPATGALVVIADPIVRVLFEHGEFNAADRMAVSPALIAFSCGLPAFLLIKIFAASFFAAQNTRTPVIIATLSVCINIAGNLILMRFFQHVGLAMATSIAGWVNASLLGLILYRRGMLHGDRELLLFLTKICVAVASMMAMLYVSADALAGWLADDGKIKKYAAMVLLVGGGGSVYVVGLFLLKAVRVEELKSWLRRGNNKASPCQG